MVVIAMSGSSERAAGYLNPGRQTEEAMSKLKQLRFFKEVALNRDATRLTDLLRLISHLQSDNFSPVRKFVAQVIGEVGSKYTELLPELMPSLLTFLADGTSAVTRQAITTGTHLFHTVLEKLVFQGLYSSEIEDSLKLSWEWLLKFKNLVLPMAFQATGNEGVRLLAVKFVEAIILLYTPDPNIPSDPPPELSNDLRFNVSWLRGGHPFLSVGDLAMEASQNLGLFLDQLKFPQVRSLSSSMTIVFINSLSAIAQRRPSFYGRILPVLLSLDPSSSLLMKEVQIPGAFHALKNAFSECFKCTHSSAEPWRARLLQALKAIDSGEAAEDSKESSGDIPSCRETQELSPFKKEGSGKRSLSEDTTDGTSENSTPSSKRVRQDTVKETDKVVSDLIWSTIKNSEAVYQLVSMFATLAAQGERAANSLEVLSSSISSELLAEVVLVNMYNLPPTQPGGDEENGAPASDVVGTFAQLASIFDDPNKVELATEAVIPSTPTKPEPEITDSEIPTPVTAVTALVALQTKPEPEISESEIPGLDSTATQRTVKIKEESPEPSLTSTADASSTGNAALPLSEEQSTSVVASSVQFVLPKMQVTNIDLSDEDKDRMQREAFVRIVESDEQLLVAGGTHTRLSLLAHIGVEFPLELNPWEALQKYALSDYVDHKGHELTVRVLYRLYRESEQDQDFLISRTATSIYESFLVTVAEALRDTFPASDKSLSKLLGEVPYLPEGALKVLEGLCSPSLERSNAEKHDKETPGGDRITQGLSCVWSLILLRPTNRDRCLQIALESAVHHLEEVRTKAIRLIANKLYPMATISKRIEEFATEKLRSIIGSAPTTDGLNADLQQDPVLGITEAQQCMSLYFALCTKKHNLLREIFTLYGDIPDPAKQVVHRHIPILIRSIGTSSVLLGIISDPPSGSENLVMKVLETLTDGLIPSRDLILAVKKLYAKIKDVEFLFPVLAYLPKEEILPLFPNFVNLPMDKLQLALSRMLPAVPQSASSLSPSEILIAIHGIDPEKDSVPLKKVMEACSACFELKTIFTQQVFAKALNQLVEQIPLPLLFMRTVIQAIGYFPGLIDFIMEIMLRLVSKQIWKYPKLWVGFLKCAIQTKPQSFSVLLQLPAPQLENALSKNPILKAPLVEHASQPQIRSALPRSSLVVLGLVQDTPPTGPTQSTSQSQAAETSKSTGDAPIEVAATEVTEDSAPRHSLLHEIFVLFGDMIHPAKQVVHEHIPLIVRSIGTSSELLGIISDPPSGSERLVMKVLETLTDGLIPSRYLISAMKKLYAKIKDADVILPVLAYLPKEEILPLFPNLVNLPMDKLQTALSRMLPAVPQSASSLTPSEVLKAIHNIEPEKDGVPLKKVTEALSACFELKTIFTQQALAKALNLLVDQIPVPFLFMRTVIQAIGVFPGLVDFSMEIMSRLVKKQVWNYPQLWTGFVKYTIHTKPHSFGVLLQVPAPQLANALSKYPILKGPLVEYASQPHIRSTLPRSLLVVLGLLQDRQPRDPT